MKKVALFLADGFEETEALVTADILRRGGIVCDLISICDEVVCGSHGIKVVSDFNIKNFSSDSYDMIVLPGGLPGADNLMNSNEIIDLVKKFSESGKFIGAICAAPEVLAKANVTCEKKVTSYPDDKYRKLLSDGNYVEDTVVCDGNIITSRGPATTFAFAYKLVEALGKDPSFLKEGMLYNYLLDSEK